MNGTTDTKAFPGFAPGENRDLLANIHRWARQYGWTWYEAWGWVSSNDLDHADFAVTWDADARTVTVRRNTGNGIYRPTIYPADTIRQAVDVLVTYLVLPPRFASAYDAGWHDGYFADVEAETAAEIRASWRKDGAR